MTEGGVSESALIKKGELIGTKWDLAEAEELCRSQNCSTNLIPVEQAHQLQYHMRKQSSKLNKKKKKK